MSSIHQKIQKHFSITYYYSTLLFPKSIREQVHILYTFLRLPDEIVDNPIYQNPEQIQAQLSDFESNFWQLYNSPTLPKVPTLPNHHSIDLNSPLISQIILTTFIHQAKTYNFNPNWIKAFFNSMSQDLIKTQYQTQAELDEYIYGSAEVVGLMMNAIMNQHSKLNLTPQQEQEQLSNAKLLGHAMQMTNFLRDFKEDFNRGRVYLPQSELRKHHLTHQDLITQIQSTTPNQNLLNLIQSTATQIQKEYKTIKQHANLIPKPARLAILTSCNIYQTVLTKLQTHPTKLLTKNLKKTKLSIPISILKSLFNK